MFIKQQVEIETLYTLLIGEYTHNSYNEYREKLIAKYGYDTFRDLQCESFKLIWRQ